jgi:hypothetical protein
MINRPAFRLILSCIVFILFYAIAWPYYQYIFDVDGIGYAAVAEYYANGQFKEAVNGYWSPLHSWLILPFLYSGITAMVAFKVSNALIAVIILMILHDYLRRTNLSATIQIAALLCSVLMLSYYAWYELAADLLVTMFFLMYVRITLSDSFHLKISYSILAGFMGGLAYLAKAYALPFFIGHFIILHLFFKRDGIRWKHLFAGLGIFTAIALPWMHVLMWKYGTLMMGTTGKLNWSWYLVPLRNDQLIFFPPPHALASCSWEDPWYLQQQFFGPWSSFKLFLHQFKVLLFNGHQWILITLQQSYLIPAIFLGILTAILYQGSIQFKKILFFCLFLPAGYWLIHIEERFLWATSFVLMITGIYLLRHLLTQYRIHKTGSLLLWILYFGSFIAEPFNWLKDNINRQKDLHILSEKMNQTELKGSFTSNRMTEECSIIAYHHKLSYYTPAPRKEPVSYFVRNAKAQGINYYLFFYELTEEKTTFLELDVIKKAKKIQFPSEQTILVAF